MKVTLKFKTGTQENIHVKNVSIRPDGDPNTGAYVTMELITESLFKYSHSYEKPISIFVESDKEPIMEII